MIEILLNVCFADDTATHTYTSSQLKPHESNDCSCPITVGNITATITQPNILSSLQNLPFTITAIGKTFSGTNGLLTLDDSGKILQSAMGYMAQSEIFIIIKYSDLAGQNVSSVQQNSTILVLPGKKGNCNYTSTIMGVWDSKDANITNSGVPDGWGGSCSVSPPANTPNSDTSKNNSVPNTTNPDKNNGVPDNSCPPTCDGNPINSATGNKFQVETDFSGVISSDLELSRTYNSQDTTATAFGANWHSTWHRSAIPSASNKTVSVTGTDGKTNTFTQNATGLWTSDPDVTSTLSVVMNGAVQTGWKLVTAEDNTEIYSLDGRLLSVTNRVGNITILAYDGGNRLNTVTDAFGHKLTYGYDSNNRVASITLPDGGVLAYGYDANNNLTSVTYPDKNTRRYVYNEQANTSNTNLPHALTGVIDESGNRFVTWQYDTKGRAVSSQHAGGVEKTTITYNADGSSKVTDALGNTHSYSFNTLFGVVKPTAVTGVPIPNTGGKSFTYDANGFVASRTDWNGNVTTYVNDNRGQELSRTEASGTAQARTINTVWHSTWHLPIQITEPSGVAGVNRVTTLAYDSNQGTLLQRTVTAGSLKRTWTYSYNKAGQIITITDPNGNVTSYAYDNAGGVNKVTNALGQVTTITNDANGRPVTITDPNNLVTKITYTPRGQVASNIVGKQVTTFAYTKNNQLQTVTKPDGSYLNYSYNAAHQLISVTDALGNHIDYTLDLNGNITAESVYDTNGKLRRSLSHSYDSVNRLVQNIGAYANETTSYSRDQKGNITSITDPNGLKTQNGFDALNRLVTNIAPNKGTTNTAYNADDSVASITDPRGVMTRYVYDGLGNQTKVISPDSGTTTRTFDAVGNVLTSTDARGKKTTNSYDKLNRLTGKLYADGTKTSFSYDQGTNGIGRLTSMTDSSGATAWVYDQYGNVTQKNQTTGSITLTTTNIYDSVTGKLTSKTLPSKNVVDYSYNLNGQIVGISTKSTSIATSINYDPFGLPSDWIQGQGMHYYRITDLDGRISDISFYNTKAPASTEQINFTNDFGGRITQIADNTVATQSFAYDAVDEVTSYTSANLTQNYTYDLGGNRTQLQFNAATPNTTNFTIAKNSNRLSNSSVGSTATNYKLDAAGNLLSDGSRNFTFDAGGHLAAVKVSSATTSYSTNGLGERVMKSSAASAIILTQDKNGNVTGEYNANNAPIQETIYLGNMPVGVLKGSTLYYVNADNLGAPRTVTTTTGVPVWTWNHEPFGSTQPVVNSSFAYNNRFPGQIYDAETGLYHNNARDYDPTTGRYIESDPIGLTGGNNTYSYVRGDPVGLIDPSGLAQCTLTYQDGDVHLVCTLPNDFLASLEKALSKANPITNFCREIYQKTERAVDLSNQYRQCLNDQTGICQRTDLRADIVANAASIVPEVLPLYKTAYTANFGR